VHDTWGASGSMPIISLAVIVAGGMWLIGIALMMAARPAYCLQILGTMGARLEAADWRLHFTEQGFRLLAGAALILRSPFSKIPLLLWVFGWMIVVSSIIIMVSPVRWHGAFATWWSRRLTPSTIRVLSPVSLLMGVGLMYLAI